MSKTKPKWFRRLRIFGYNIYITREAMRHKDPFRNRARMGAKKERLRQTESHCELCGRIIGIDCHLHRLLPQGHPDRNMVRNIRVLCPCCKRHVQLSGVYRPMLPQKGGAHES